MSVLIISSGLVTIWFKKNRKSENYAFGIKNMNFLKIRIFMIWTLYFEFLDETDHIGKILDFLFFLRTCMANALRVHPAETRLPVYRRQ